MFCLAACDRFASEPFPVTRTEISVGYGTMRNGAQSIGWIDDQRLAVLVGERKDTTPRQSGREIQSLQFWDAQSKTLTPLVPADVAGLCVSGNYLRLHVRHKNVGGGITPKFFAGPVESIRPSDPGPFNPMNCRLLKDQSLPEWTQGLPEKDVLRLRPEHGFIAIEREGQTPWARSVMFYRPGVQRGRGVELYDQFAGLNGSARIDIWPQYVEFAHAYILGRSQAKDVPIWLDPLARRSNWPLMPMSSDSRLPNHLGGGMWHPTGRGAVIGVAPIDIRTPGKGGLYLHQPGAPPKRIVSGRIGKEIRVSPNGCLVAYGNDDRESIVIGPPGSGVLHYKLQVIDLCQPKLR